jgi:sulfate transport system permease protein
LRAPAAGCASWRAQHGDAVSATSQGSALRLTWVSLVVALVNVARGHGDCLVARPGSLVGQGFVNALVDCRLRAGIDCGRRVVASLRAEASPVGINAAFTRWGLLLALLFVTLPFVVRTVQPILFELDREMEDAAASLGAGRFTTFRRIILPSILPAILSGVALAFARAVGEFGAVVLISGNLPFKTEVASVYVFGRLESGDPGGAAAASVVLLLISFGVLLAIGGLRRWVTKHDR